MTLDLRVLVEKSLHEPLTYDDIQKLSVSSRCALIRGIIENRREKKAFGDFVPENSSLQALNRAFNISSGFHEWQRKKRRYFIIGLMRKENRYILTAFRNWEKLSIEAKKYALRQSVQLHRDTYIEGLTEKLPYKYEFEDGAFRYSNGGLVLTFGNFSGSIKSGKSKITQFLNNGELLGDASDAFNTAHHEATHLVQHHLSVAYDRNQMSLSHPLFVEAAYFYSVDRHKAYIPTSFEDAYRSQPNEVFAHWEGEKISAAIHSLAI